jgi:hypothetical protein
MEPPAHPLSEAVSRFVAHHDSYIYPELTNYPRRNLRWGPASAWVEQV